MFLKFYSKVYFLIKYFKYLDIGLQAELVNLLEDYVLLCKVAKAERSNNGYN